MTVYMADQMLNVMICRAAQDGNEVYLPSVFNESTSKLQHQLLRHLYSGDTGPTIPISFG
jgi:hypothetical protein